MRPREMRERGNRVQRIGQPLFRRPSDGTALRSDERLFGGFLARASVDTTDRLKAGAVQIDEEREITRMEIVKKVSIPY